MGEEEAQYVKPQVERRQYRRAQLITQVRCETLRRDELLVTRDLSAGGLFLRSSNPLPSGAEVKLAFRLRPDEPLLSCRGTVVNSITGRGMGIEFRELDEPTRQALQKFVDESF